VADDIASRNIVYIEKLPPAGELRTICAATSPRRGSGGKYRSPPRTLPVASSQFSTNAPWSRATIGPSMRTSVSRQCPSVRPSPIHFGLTPDPPVNPISPSTISMRR
jgi:hypothetical protein